MTLKVTPSATSSPGSAAGPTRSGSQGGPTISPSGPAPVPVSRFRARDSDKAMPINDTSGPLFTASSPSAALQRSLESKLRARMDGNGSPEYALTWSTWDMPAGVPICRLRASARRTSGNGSGGWPTPRARDHHKEGPRHHYSPSLAKVVENMVGWTTPQTHDAQGRSNPERFAEARDEARLPEPQRRSGLGRVADTQCSERRALDHTRRDAGFDGLPQGQEGSSRIGSGGEYGRVADASTQHGRAGAVRENGPQTCNAGGVGDAARVGRLEERQDARGREEGSGPQGRQQRPWDSAAWIPCGDGKARRVEPGIHPLAHGVPARVGRLRAYGNAIVPQVAAEFIRAFEEVIEACE